MVGLKGSTELGAWVVIGSCFDVNPCNLCTSELGEARLGFKLCKVRSGQVRLCLGQVMFRAGYV